MVQRVDREDAIEGAVLPRQVLGARPHQPRRGRRERARAEHRPGRIDAGRAGDARLTPSRYVSRSRATRRRRWTSARCRSCRAKARRVIRVGRRRQPSLDLRQPMAGAAADFEDRERRCVAEKVEQRLAHPGVVVDTVARVEDVGDGVIVGDAALRHRYAVVGLAGSSRISRAACASSARTRTSNPTRTTPGPAACRRRNRPAPWRRCRPRRARSWPDPLPAGCRTRARRSDRLLPSAHSMGLLAAQRGHRIDGGGRRAPAGSSTPGRSRRAPGRSQTASRHRSRSRRAAPPPSGGRARSPPSPRWRGRARSAAPPARARSRVTSPLVAPSAIRTPISRTRCATR